MYFNARTDDAEMFTAILMLRIALHVGYYGDHS